MALQVLDHVLHPMLAAVYKVHLASTRSQGPFVVDVEGDTATLLKNVVEYVKE